MRTKNSVWRAAAICALAALLTVCTACRRAPRVQAAEYEVLSAFIDGQLASRKGVVPISPEGDGITKTVISNMSESDQDGLNAHWAQTANSLQSEAPTLKRDTIDGFRDANRQQASFQPSFHPVSEYELVDSSRLDSIFKNGSWPAFYKRFPGAPGIMTFFRVGFSSDETQARFFVSNRCGALCGGGAYVVMERRDGRWTIEKPIEAWVS